MKLMIVVESLFRRHGKRNESSKQTRGKLALNNIDRPKKRKPRDIKNET